MVPGAVFEPDPLPELELEDDGVGDPVEEFEVPEELFEEVPPGFNELVRTIGVFNPAVGAKSDTVRVPDAH